MGGAADTWRGAAATRVPHRRCLRGQDEQQIDTCSLWRHERMPTRRSLVPPHGHDDVAKAAHIRHDTSPPISTHRHADRAQDVRVRGLGAGHERRRGPEGVHYREGVEVHQHTCMPRFGLVSVLKLLGCCKKFGFIWSCNSLPCRAVRSLFTVVSISI